MVFPCDLKLLPVSLFIYLLFCLSSLSVFLYYVFVSLFVVRPTACPFICPSIRKQKKKNLGICGRLEKHKIP